MEQFFVTSPDNDASWAALEEMLTNAEDFYQALEVPYQVMLFSVRCVLLSNLAINCAQKKKLLARVALAIVLQGIQHCHANRW